MEISINKDAGLTVTGTLYSLADGSAVESQAMAPGDIPEIYSADFASVGDFYFRAATESTWLCRGFIQIRPDSYSTYQTLEALEAATDVEIRKIPRGANEKVGGDPFKINGSNFVDVLSGVSSPGEREYDQTVS